MQQDKRRHKRFSLNVMEMNGKMFLAHKFELLDISEGGVSLQTDRRLNIGKEYLIKLGNREKNLEVRGMIIRCALTKIEEDGEGQGVSIYTAAMMFKDVPAEVIADFIHSSELARKVTGRAVVNQRLHVRFYIVASGENTLIFPAQFKVKEISLSGMQMETDLALEIESRVPMGLSIQETGNSVNFTGRVVTCSRIESQWQSHYDIGVEFKDLTDKDKGALKTFIDYLTALEE